MTDLAAVSNPLLTSPRWQSEFRAWLEYHGKSTKTISSYLSDVHRFSDWFAAVNDQPLTPGLISGYDLRAYREHAISVEQVKPATWNRRRATLAALCSWAQTAGYLQVNPSQGIRPMGETELAPRWLNRPDQGRLMRQLERQINGAATDAWRKQAARDAAMVLLMRYAGLRVGEVVALNLGDITLSERAGRVDIRRGKGDKAGCLPLNSEVRAALAYWLNLRGPGTSGEPVFTGKSTDRLTTRQVQRRMAEISRLAGVDCTPHQLRHTCLKSLVDANTPLTTVQDFGRHARLETTKRYIKPGWDELAAAVEKII
ncbi:MAG TPA: tyrosine-type recombinase/integrase [Anaerolineales bacterium]|nr:tyrosine-type recombinase/integrase [Anaerolineales bacterium]